MEQVIIHNYQKVLRSEEIVAKLKLVGRGKKQPAHVDGQKIGAVTASDRHRLEQAGTRNTYLCVHLCAQIQAPN